MAPKPSFYKKHRTLFNPNSVYNGQDILKNHFLHGHPVIYTDNVSDLSQAEKYAETHSHVWLVDKSIEPIRTFPWWFKIPPNSEGTVFQFPCVYKNSWKMYDWTRVQLVPTKPVKKFTQVRQRQVAAEYDLLRGKKTFDKFFIGDKLPNELMNKDVTCVDSISEAQRQTDTEMCWIIPNDVKVHETFKFDYVPDYWSLHYCHVFKNKDNYDGILLMPKSYEVTKNEEAYWFFILKKEVSIDASEPVPYDRFYVSSYEEYLDAATKSTTRMFWAINGAATVSSDFDFDYYVSKQDPHATSSTHVFDNGVCLFSVDNLVTKREFEYNHFINKIEVD